MQARVIGGIAKFAVFAVGGMLLMAFPQTSHADTVGLIQPAHRHDTRTATVVFTWGCSGVLSTTCTADTFLLRICRDSTSLNGCTNVLYDSKTTVTSGTVPLPFEDTFYWTVIPIDTKTNTPHDTPAYRAIFLDTHTETPSLTSPTSGSTTSDSTPTLAWSAPSDSSGIDTFAWELTTSAFTSLAAWDTLDGSVTESIVYAGTGLVNATYYWRVRAIDYRGNGGPFSDSKSFTVNYSAVSTETKSYASDSTPDVTLPNSSNSGTDKKPVLIRADTSVTSLSATSYSTACTFTISGRTDTFGLYVLTNQGTTVILIRAPADSEVTLNETTASVGFSVNDTGLKAFKATLIDLSFGNKDAPATALTDLSSGTQTYSYFVEWRLSKDSWNLVVAAAGGDTNALAVWSATSVNSTSYSSVASLALDTVTSNNVVVRSTSALTTASIKVIGAAGSGSSSGVKLPSACVIGRWMPVRAQDWARAFRDAALRSSAGRVVFERYYRFVD